MSLYEWLARRAWQKGNFNLDSAASSWSEPLTTTAPEELREKLRREMEKIVTREAEVLATDTVKNKQEGRMKLAKFVKFREEKFGAVLFETRQEKVYTLNPTGAAVVKEIVAGEANVLAKIKDQFNDTTGKIEAEVNDFLADLKAKGLLTE